MRRQKEFPPAFCFQLGERLCQRRLRQILKRIFQQRRRRFLLWRWLRLPLTFRRLYGTRSRSRNLAFRRVCPVIRLRSSQSDILSGPPLRLGPATSSAPRPSLHLRRTYSRSALITNIGLRPIVRIAALRFAPRPVLLPAPGFLLPRFRQLLFLKRHFLRLRLIGILRLQFQRLEQRRLQRSMITKGQPLLLCAA